MTADVEWRDGALSDEDWQEGQENSPPPKKKATVKGALLHGAGPMLQSHTLFSLGFGCISMFTVVSPLMWPGALTGAHLSSVDVCCHMHDSQRQPVDLHSAARCRPALVQPACA